MAEATPPPGDRFRVGDFLLDRRSGELRSDAGRQVLSAQPLHFLLALIERPGELVTRDELRARLWPADTYVDFEHGLNAVVKRLRDALGDAADTPRYIETVPRRGYRLIAQVSPAGEPNPAPAAATSVPVLRRFAPLIAGGVVVAALAALVYGLRSAPAEAGLERRARSAGAQPVRLTFGAGLQTDAAWSPDGRRIAYASDGDGNFDLFIQGVDGGEPVRLTRTPANETQPAWSPDGERIAFRSDDDGHGGGLYTVRPDGGAIRRISDVGVGPIWMPDGRDILFAGSQLQALFLIKADGGEAPREILKGELSNGAWSSFTVHPDGRIGLFGIHPHHRLGFYVSDARHQRLRSVTSGIRIPDELTGTHGRAHWNKAGDAVFVEGVSAGVPTVWRVPVEAETLAWGTPVQVTTGLASADRPAISPDGTTLAFTRAQVASRAWVFPFDADRGVPPGEGRPVTDEDASIGGLSVSHDGTAIFYQEVRPGRTAVPGLRTRLDTGETTVLFADGSGGPVPAPDGGGTAYLLVRGRTGASDAEYALAWRTADGREHLLSPWGLGAPHPSDVRRDGQAVLVIRLRRAYTGPSELVEWPIGSSPTAEPRRVLLQKPGTMFWQARYSPDGRWVSFVAVQAGAEERLELGIASTAVEASAIWTRVAADHPWPDKPRWSPDGRTLYFLSRSASGYYALWGIRIDLEHGGPIGMPFRIKAFDSPRWHIDPNPSTCELGMGKGRLVLPMRTVKGSIWLLSNAGT